MRYGLIFGGILAVLGIVDTVLRSGTDIAAGSGNAVGGGLGCLFFLISLVLLGAAGWMAARETGRTGSGAVAGLIAGLVGSLVLAIGLLVLVLSLSTADLNTVAQNSKQNLTPDQARQVVTIAIVFVDVIIVLLAAGVGAGLGALGGLIGKGQFNGPMNPYQQSYYQGPQGGYPPPGYPPTGGYPPPGAPGSYPPPPGAYPQPGAYPPPPGSYPPPTGYPPQDDSQTRPPQYPNS